MTDLLASLASQLLEVLRLVALNAAQLQDHPLQSPSRVIQMHSTHVVSSLARIVGVARDQPNSKVTASEKHDLSVESWVEYTAPAYPPRECELRGQDAAVAYFVEYQVEPTRACECTEVFEGVYFEFSQPSADFSCSARYPADPGE